MAMIDILAAGGSGLIFYIDIGNGSGGIPVDIFGVALIPDLAAVRDDIGDPA